MRTDRDRLSQSESLFLYNDFSYYGGGGSQKLFLKVCYLKIYNKLNAKDTVINTVIFLALLLSPMTIPRDSSSSTCSLTELKMTDNFIYKDTF